MEDELYDSLKRTCESSKIELSFAKIFGEKSEIKQGERRFIIRRYKGTTYLIGERRSGERRIIEC
jgi:hypothetical protein